MGIQPPPALPAELAAVASAIRTGERTAREVLESCIERIEQRESAIRAWVKLDLAGARDQADQRDAEQSAGRIRGPLHGVPVGVKDIVDVAGMPTGAGAQKWASRAAARDADLVAALRSAGAVFLGKTQTTAYAWLDPAPTGNPWKADRTPGGSSSGSAAAVAAGMCLGAVGSQTGGSIIRPASYCGVAGMKPSYGRISAQGFVPLAPSLDHPGFIAGSVAGLAAMWQAATGSFEPVRSAPCPPRVGRVRGVFHDPASADSIEAVDRALDRLRHAGAEVIEVALPGQFASIATQHRVLLAAEAASVHARRYHDCPDDYPSWISRLVEEGMALPATAYIFARQHQERWRRSIGDCLAGVDVLAMPATPGVAPDKATTGDPAFNSPWSYLGLPALTLPVASDDEGLPLGLQLVAAPNTEAALLGTALWCEHRLGL